MDYSTPYHSPILRKIKVAKIIDEYTVVINVGSDDGVHDGDRFEIYDPGEEVRDPVNNRFLGRLEYVKATITATQVYPRMAVCKNVQIATILDGFDISRGKHRELRVAATEISGGFDRTIHIGDDARHIPTAPDSNP